MSTITNPLRVFLAKSFREIDQERIKPIETFLNSFAKLGVLIETGEPSEPESISQKVRERIDHADVFVGIFTKRFPICRSRGRFRTALELILEGPADWSAPPWVLQECGYAIRKGCALILFVEVGVDLGGLQGDLEFIPYDYREPSEALTKASFMLNSLVAQRYGAVVQTSIEIAQESATVQAGIQASAPAPADTSDENVVGTDEPQSGDYILPVFRDLMHALESRDFEGAERLFHDGLRLISDDQAAANVSKLRWKILYYTNLFRRGDATALDNLRETAGLNPSSPDVRRAIASCLRSYGEFELASIEFLRAADLSDSPERYECRLLAASCLLKAGKKNEARDMLVQTAIIAGNGISSDLRSRLMMELLSAFKESANPFLGFALAEIGLRENPANTALRFQLGREYSDARFFGLNALHYKVLVDHDPMNAGSFHNFAVACIGLSLPITAITHYQRALELGETLSASNMSYKLLEAGFSNQCEQCFKTPF